MCANFGKELRAAAKKEAFLIWARETRGTDKESKTKAKREIEEKSLRDAASPHVHVHAHVPMRNRPSARSRKRA